MFVREHSPGMSRELYPALNVERSLPLNYDTMAPGKESFIRPFESFGPINLYELENVYVSHQGVVLKSGRVIPESVYGMFEPRRQWSGFYKKILRGKRRVIPKPVLVVHHHFYDNYYHWLSEIMPRLFVAREILRETALLMPARLPQFVADFLNLLPVKEIVSIADDEVVKTPRVYFPSHIARPLAYNEAVMTEFSEWLGAKLDDSSITKSPEKLFISRKNARYRITHNEEKIQEYLESKGFELARPEELTIRGQMNLFKNVRIIAGSHGAGFANLIFARNCRLLIDIIHKDHPQDCFFNLANVNRTQYYYFQCEGTGRLAFKNNDDVIADPLIFKERVGPLL